RARPAFDSWPLLAAWVLRQRTPSRRSAAFAMPTERVSWISHRHSRLLLLLLLVPHLSSPRHRLLSFRTWSRLSPPRHPPWHHLAVHRDDASGPRPFSARARQHTPCLAT